MADTKFSSTDLRKLQEMLWREIERTPGDLPAFQRAQLAARTAIDCPMTPAIRKYLILVGLHESVLRMLEEAAEREADDEPEAEELTP